MTVPLRAALYLRVSTARQAEHDVSIPDQKRQHYRLESNLLQTLAAAGVRPATPGVRSSVLKWRSRQDSNL